jgi:hypothetical protein
MTTTWTPGASETATRNRERKVAARMPNTEPRTFVPAFVRNPELLPKRPPTSTKPR